MRTRTPATDMSASAQMFELRQRELAGEKFYSMADVAKEFQQLIASKQSVSKLSDDEWKERQQKCREQANELKARGT